VKRPVAQFATKEMDLLRLLILVTVILMFSGMSVAQSTAGCQVITIN